jgi:hypothetical protein
MGKPVKGSVDFKGFVTFVMEPKNKGPTILVCTSIEEIVVPCLDPEHKSPGITLGLGGQTHMISIFNCPPAKVGDLYEFTGVHINLWETPEGTIKETLKGASIRHMPLTFQTRKAQFDLIPQWERSIVSARDVPTAGSAKNEFLYRFNCYYMGSNGDQPGCPQNTCRFLPQPENAGMGQSLYLYARVDQVTSAVGPAQSVIGGGMIGNKSCKAELLVHTSAGSMVIVHGRVYDTSSLQINWPMFGNYLQTELLGEMIIILNEKDTNEIIQGEFDAVAGSLQFRADMAGIARAKGFKVSYAQAKGYTTLPDSAIPKFDLISATAINLCQISGTTSFLEEAAELGWIEFYVLPNIAPPEDKSEVSVTEFMTNMKKYRMDDFAYGVFMMPTDQAPTQVCSHFLEINGQVAARSCPKESAKRILERESVEVKRTRTDKDVA